MSTPSSTPTLTDALLRPILAVDAARPLVTYYDDATDERVEVSATTLANWAAKTANLLRDELGVGLGDPVAVLLPAHWQSVAVHLGVWWCGAEVVSSADGAELALCTRERLGEAEAAPEVAVLSLDAFGRAADGLPLGITDYASAVRVHGDAFAPTPVGGEALALEGRSVAQVLTAARATAAHQGLTAADRVLSSRQWSTPAQLVDGLLAVLVAGASLVQVANVDDSRTTHRVKTEKVTREL